MPLDRLNVGLYNLNM